MASIAMTSRQLWLNLGGLGVLIALMELAYWLNTGARTVEGYYARPAGHAWVAEYNLRI
jgi:hypothetical protein